VFLRIAIRLAVSVALCAPLLRADEITRQVQEELRKRNLFFGDIDGRQTGTLAAAIKTYQERKGFTATGEPDPDTIRSLGISPSQPGADLPNVPVLMSDRGLAEGAGAGPDQSAVNEAKPVNIETPTRTELRTFVRSYLDACQTPPVDDDLHYYAGRVKYLGHGNVTKTYIRNELVAYGQQWPEREYVIGDPFSFVQRGGAIVARCRISFKISNPEQSRRASGVTANTFVLERRRDQGWEIVGRNEERVRAASSTTKRTASSRRRPKTSPFMRRLDRSLRKFFR